MPNMLLEKSIEKNFRKNEETEPKQKQCAVVDIKGDGSKVRCCNNNIARDLEC